jgi:hypothetical protein
MLPAPSRAPGLFSLVLVLAPLTGCGGGEDEFTADVAGSYTVGVTNRASTCNLENWMEGNMSQGIQFDIMQEGSELDATVDGLTGIYVALVLGSADFEGSVRGYNIQLTNYGTNSFNEGNCTFTYNASLAGRIDDDAISGTITYAPATNDNPDCADVECSAVQEFSGSRPPN